jgi:uncharacterized Zn finger protein
MRTFYENCPYCHSKKVVEIEKGNTILIKCTECENIIDRFPKEEPHEPNLGI